MDDVVSQLSRELAHAMAAAVAGDPRVEACHEKAKASGYEMRVSLEALIGFAHRTSEPELAKVGVAVEHAASAPKEIGMNSNDRRFLRSLRIAADEAWQPAD
jgi:hypothetical protein